MASVVLRLGKSLLSKVLSGGFCFLLAALLIFPFTAFAQNIHFDRFPSNIGDDSLNISQRESQRIEHFLRRVYPVRAMGRMVQPRSGPLLRKVRYDLVELSGMKYIVAAYVAEFEGDQFVHDIAIYRMEPQGPNQIWRCKPWRANYFGLTFETAKAGEQMLLLVREGGLDPSGFSISGVFAFKERDTVFLVRDITPRLPHLIAVTHFPSRPLYGQKVALQQTKDGEVLLAASDEDFRMSDLLVTPTNFWRFNKRKVRFESVKSKESAWTVTQTLAKLPSAALRSFPHDVRDNGQRSRPKTQKFIVEVFE